MERPIGESSRKLRTRSVSTSMSGTSKRDPIAAIKKAVDYVARANGLNAAAEEAAPDPVPEVKTPSKKQTQKKVEAKTKQPQNLPKGERVEQSVDMESMSEEEFDALPRGHVSGLR